MVSIYWVCHTIDSVIGAFIVTVKGFAEPVNEPNPDPVAPLYTYLVFDELLETSPPIVT